MAKKEKTPLGKLVEARCLTLKHAILVYLALNDTQEKLESQKLTDIATGLSVSTNTVSMAVTQLEQENLVWRGFGEHDKRTVFVNLDTKGRQLANADLCNLRAALRN